MSDKSEQRNNFHHRNLNIGDSTKNNVKNNLLEIIHSIQKKMQLSDIKFTKEEIISFFKNIPLSEQQQDMVCQYLLQLQQESQSGLLEHTGMQTDLVNDVQTESADKIKLPDTAFFRLYLEDLQNITQCTKEEEEELYEHLIAGDEKSMHQLSEQWMLKVLQIAKRQIHITEPKDLADMIQEGNIAVFLALQQMLGCGKKINFEKELMMKARNAMDEYSKKMMKDTDMDQSLLAKAALVYEAQKYLAEQMQRMPSIEELSQYTKITVSEMEDILT